MDIWNFEPKSENSTIEFTFSQAKNFFGIKMFPDDPERPYQTIYNNAIDKYVTRVKDAATKLKPK